MLVLNLVLRVLGRVLAVVQILIVVQVLQLRGLNEFDLLLAAVSAGVGVVGVRSLLLVSLTL